MRVIRRHLDEQLVDLPQSDVLITRLAHTVDLEAYIPSFELECQGGQSRLTGG